MLALLALLIYGYHKMCRQTPQLREGNRVEVCRGFFPSCGRGATIQTGLGTPDERAGGTDFWAEHDLSILSVVLLNGCIRGHG